MGAGVGPVEASKGGEGKDDDDGDDDDAAAAHAHRQPISRVTPTTHSIKPQGRRRGGKEKEEMNTSPENPFKKKKN